MKCAPGKDNNERTRLDLWLWASRFYKTRKSAVDAINAGRVRLFGQLGKPGKFIRPGDRLTIRKSGLTYQIQIEAISRRRLDTAGARALYKESAGSALKREQEIEQRRIANNAVCFARNKPSPRDRRRLRALKTGQ